MASSNDSGRKGQWVTSTVTGETVRAFLPPGLPPLPPIELAGLSALTSEAMLALGRLDGVRSVAPDTSLFLYMYVRKEALLSSQIEGTQSSLSDLLLYEDEAAPGVPLDDVEEVSTYVAALTHGLDRIRGGFPLSLRLLKEMHGVLLSSGRGARSSRASSAAAELDRRDLARQRPVRCRRPSVLDLMIIQRSCTRRTLACRRSSRLNQIEIHPFLDGNGGLGAS